jgi:hypothetical protein
MNADQSPGEMSEFERRLQDRLVPEATPALRSRIMHSVAQELLRSPGRSRPATGFLSFAAAMAAALLIGLNLSITTTAGVSLDSHVKPTREQTIASAESLRQISPDLSADEAMRIAIVLQAGGNLKPLPTIQARATTEHHEAIDGAPERNIQ